MNGKKVGLGVVMRYSNGKVLNIAVRRRIGGWEPSVAEAVALCYGVEMSWSFGYSRVWMENDALIIVEKIKGKMSGLA
uniref:RNase H type-1 domain-containing protein n=1 Tax=Chenopodium quinoa TaxID=63459 RepID=A0A803MAU0_CHEQI